MYVRRVPGHHGGGCFEVKYERRAVIGGHRRNIRIHRIVMLYMPTISVYTNCNPIVIELQTTQMACYATVPAVAVAVPPAPPP